MFFVWLFFYGLTALLCRHLSHLTPWALPVGHLLNTMLLIGWLFSQQQQDLLLFKKRPRQTYLLFLLCLLPAVCQLFFFGFPSHSELAILCIFLAAAQEELLFRGILLRLFCRKGPIFGIVLSTIVFAAAHLVNLESGAEPAVVLNQVIYALAASFALSGICLSFDCLLPCIGIHFLNNITASNIHQLTPASVVPFLLCLVVWFTCGIGCIFYLRAKKGNLHETIH